MKVKNTTICLECDEVFHSDLKACPSCTNRTNYRLVDWIGNKLSTIVKSRPQQKPWFTFVHGAKVNLKKLVKIL